MSDNKTKHWFDDGEYHSARVIGKFTLTVETDEEHIRDSTLYSFFRARDIEQLLVHVLTMDANGIPLCVMTGNSIIPECFLEDTKEEALNNYFVRLKNEHIVAA